MSQEANKLIAELLGDDPVCVAQDYGGKPEFCCLCGYKGCTVQDCPVSKSGVCPNLRYPDYCGNDNDALAGIKALAKRGIRIKIMVIPLKDTPPLLLPEHVNVFMYKGESDEGFTCNGTRPSHTLHDAFGDAMVEGYDKRMHNYILNISEGTIKAIRIRPAVEAAVKGVRK